MATLADITRQLARFVHVTSQGFATGGSSTQLVDTELQGVPGKYKDGTIWFVLCTNSGLTGKYTRILSFAEGVITFAAQQYSVTAGDHYMILDSTFPVRTLVGAINSVLALYPVRKSDVTLTYDPDVPIIDLPVGVNNVLRVEVEEGDANSDTWVPTKFWHELPDGKLHVYGGLSTSDSGSRLKIWYEGRADEVAHPTDVIDPQVNMEYLLHASAVNLWRMNIELTKQDNSVALDLMNEAKVLESQSKMKMFTPHLRKDVQLAKV